MRTLARSLATVIVAAGLVAAPATAHASDGDCAYGVPFDAANDPCAAPKPEPKPAPAPAPAPPQAKPEPAPQPKPAPKPPAPKPAPKPAPEPKAPAPKPAPKPAPRPKAPAPRPAPQPAPRPQEAPNPPRTYSPPRAPQPAPPTVRTPRPRREPAPRVRRNATPPKPGMRATKRCVVVFRLKAGSRVKVRYTIRNGRGTLVRKVTVPGNSTRKVQVPLRGDGPWKFVVRAPGFRKVHREPACDCSPAAKAASSLDETPLLPAPLPEAPVAAATQPDDGLSGSEILMGLGTAALLGLVVLAVRRRPTTVPVTTETGDSDTPRDV